MFDFPNAPSNGQIATGPGGISYTWDNTKWVATSAGGVAYAPLASPVFTGDPQAPTPAVTDSDTSIATTAFVQAVAAPFANNTGRNLIHNGQMNTAQRGTAAFSSVGYTLDRWLLQFSNDTTSVQQQPLGDTQRAAIGDEAAVNCMVCAVVGNAAAGAFSFVSQPVEGVRRLAGKTVTISLWAYATAGTPKFGIGLRQWFGTGGSPSAMVDINATPITVSTTPTRYSVTIALPSASGKTVGTNGDDFTRLALFLSSGANTNTLAGGIGVQTATFVFWGVQLEIGSVATRLDQGGSPQQVLAECQRFYQTGQAYAGGYSAGNVSAIMTWVFPVVMRGTPTVAVTTNADTNLTSPTTTAFAGTAVAFVGATPAGAVGWSINRVFTASADL